MVSLILAHVEITEHLSCYYLNCWKGCNTVEPLLSDPLLSEFQLSGADFMKPPLERTSFSKGRSFFFPLGRPP